MEQFNLEKYNALIAEGKKPRIVTRDGRDVRILCTDLDDEDWKVAAEVLIKGDISLYMYLSDGRYYQGGAIHPNDLFFAPTKHEGWIVIDVGVGAAVFATKEEAEHLEIIMPPKDDRVVAHIEWEE